MIFAMHSMQHPLPGFLSAFSAIFAVKTVWWFAFGERNRTSIYLTAKITKTAENGKQSCAVAAV